MSFFGNNFRVYEIDQRRCEKKMLQNIWPFSKFLLNAHRFEFVDSDPDARNQAASCKEYYFDYGEAVFSTFKLSALQNSNSRDEIDANLSNIHFAKKELEKNG